VRHPARSLVAGGLLIAAALTFLVYQGISNNMVYYITPSELLAKGSGAVGQDFRLGGQVRPGSRRWNPRTQVLDFVLQDPRGHVDVQSHGVPPEMFREGIGVVVEGKFTGHMFMATNLMVKHCATYVAPKPGHVPPPDQCVTS
jgi:cytochrome c-type biogenesis protein CcmE